MHKSEWISVKDRLPESELSIICWQFLDNDEQYFSIEHLSEYTPKSFFQGVQGIGEKRFRKITHWMPLSEMPEITNG